MSSNNKYFLWIGRYLRDELSDSEKMLFEKELKNNKDLQKEYKLEKEILTTISKEKDIRKFKSTLREVEESFFSKQKKKIVIMIHSIFKNAA